ERCAVLGQLIADGCNALGVPSDRCVRTTQRLDASVRQAPYRPHPGEFLQEGCCSMLTTVPAAQRLEGPTRPSEAKNGRLALSVEESGIAPPAGQHSFGALPIVLSG